MPPSPITYISFPSPLSYGASTLNDFANVQPDFRAGSTCLGKLLPLLYGVNLREYLNPLISQFMGRVMYTVVIPAQS